MQDVAKAPGYDGGIESVEVTIEGQPYSVRSTLGSTQVKRLADYVDRVMRDIRKHTQTNDSNRVAILAALNIAEDLFQVRGSCDEAAQRTKELIDLMDEKCNS